MQTVKLRSLFPHAGTNVTRLWLAPGAVRVGAVLGHNILGNGAGLCWDTGAGRVLWETALHDEVETFPEPDFDRDLTRAVYPVYSEAAEDGQLARLTVRDLLSGDEVSLGRVPTDIPVMARDGRCVIAVADRNRELRRWSLPPRLGVGGSGSDSGGAFAPDHEWVIRLPRGGRRLIDQVGQDVTALTASPDGKCVAAGRRNGSVVVWNIGNRRTVMTAPALKSTAYLPLSVRRLAFSPDGIRLVAVRGRRVKKAVPFTATVWAVSEGKQLKGPKETVSVNGTAFGPDGRTLLTSREDGTIGVWDTTTWKLNREYAWDIGSLFSVALAPDGLTGAAGGEDGQIVIWDVDS